MPPSTPSRQSQADLMADHAGHGSPSKTAFPTPPYVTAMPVMSSTSQPVVGADIPAPISYYNLSPENSPTRSECAYVPVRLSPVFSLDGSVDQPIRHQHTPYQDRHQPHVHYQAQHHYVPRYQHHPEQSQHHQHHQPQHHQPQAQHPEYHQQQAQHPEYHQQQTQHHEHYQEQAQRPEHYQEQAQHLEYRHEQAQHPGYRQEQAQHPEYHHQQPQHQEHYPEQHHEQARYQEHHQEQSQPYEHHQKQIQPQEYHHEQGPGQHYAPPQAQEHHYEQPQQHHQEQPPRQTHYAAQRQSLVLVNNDTSTDHSPLPSFDHLIAKLAASPTSATAISPHRRKHRNVPNPEHRYSQFGRIRMHELARSNHRDFLDTIRSDLRTMTAVHKRRADRARTDSNNNASTDSNPDSPSEYEQVSSQQAGRAHEQPQQQPQQLESPAALPATSASPTMNGSSVNHADSSAHPQYPEQQTVDSARPATSGAAPLRPLAPAPGSTRSSRRGDGRARQGPSATPSVLAGEPARVRKRTARRTADAGLADSALPASPAGLQKPRPPSTREDRDFEKFQDFCPPVPESLDTKSFKTEWKGQPLDLSADPHNHLLNPAEVGVASVLRLSCAVYLTSKRRIFIARLDAFRTGKEFRKTDAQQACKIDVNKASKLWAVFDKAGWFRREHFEHILSQQS